MSWIYCSRTGRLFHGRRFVASGYSGSGEGLNNPEHEGQRNVGPIPVGEYQIQSPRTSKATGQYVLPLAVVENDQPHRGGFQIHGDNGQGDKSASNGCIVLPREVRGAVWLSGDRRLFVVPF